VHLLRVGSSPIPGTNYLQKLQFIFGDIF
jgi:hypothetical protein